MAKVNRLTATERFWSKTKGIGKPGCWEWTAALETYGYGHCRWRGVVSKAHRVAFELANGPIPDGLLVRHMCDNAKCCNPAHLELGTHAQNMQDKVERGAAYRASLPLTTRDRTDILELAQGRRDGLCLWATHPGLAAVYDVTTSAISTILRNDRRKQMVILQLAWFSLFLKRFA